MKHWLILAVLVLIGSLWAAQHPSSVWSGTLVLLPTFLAIEAFVAFIIGKEARKEWKKKR
jgi:hypothetical protein